MKTNSRRRYRIGLLLIFSILSLRSGRGQEILTPPADTEVTVEVFSDFQCPYCKQFAPAVRELESKGTDGVKTKVVFRNFPLGFHPFAQLAAQAAAAAGEQGKFWEMHDLLFAHQSALGREDLLKYAQSLSLDMAKFNKDIDSEQIKKQIDADKADGNAKKVEGTPTFFVNGKGYSGTKSFAELTLLVAGDARRKIALSEISDASMSKGPADAPVTIEFFADLESPVSRSANYMLERVMAQYPSAIRLQFRNFPLAFHPQAALAHDAAMTAARSGHFWEMANYVFDHQDSLREQDLIAYAGQLGIDQASFAEMIQKRRYTPRVDADVADGFQRGVHGSPVIFINNQRIDGVPSLQVLTQDVNAAMSAKSEVVAKKE